MCVTCVYICIMANLPSSPLGIAIPCIAENPRIAKRILYSMLYLTKKRNKTFIITHTL